MDQRPPELCPNRTPGAVLLGEEMYDLALVAEDEYCHATDVWPNEDGEWFTRCGLKATTGLLHNATILPDCPACYAVVVVRQQFDGSDGSIEA